MVYVYTNEISNRNWKPVAAGLVMSKLLHADPKLKILGVNNRLLLAIANAGFGSGRIAIHGCLVK